MTQRWQQAWGSALAWLSPGVRQTGGVRTGKGGLVKIGRCKPCREASPGEGRYWAMKRNPAQGADGGISQRPPMVSVRGAEVERPEGGPSSVGAEGDDVNWGW